ncbi:hypothetical protein [Coraliomargarita parva]|uniref:hypothetical protein n=1 Tax=Coraliomargarita parva TaxID=3014050 RepID=UPI0022B3C475|nr:hypothetical protein [Coraliomargarita parva]
MADASTDSPRWNPFEEYRRDRQWVTVLALLLALLFHLTVYWVLPEQVLSSHAVESDQADQEVELTLIPAEEPVTPDEMHYAEVNPDAPENEPDKTDRYSFQAQQAADEAPVEDLLDAPNVEGDSSNMKILQGDLSPPSPIEPGVYSTAAQEGQDEGTQGGEPGSPEQATQMAQSQPLPAPDFIQQDPVTEEGPGSSPDLSGEASERVEGIDPNAPIDLYRQQPQQETPAKQATGDGGQPEARPMPRERPRLSPELITGPLLDSRGSASRRGAIALDATFSEFGEYEQQFYAALQVGWYQEIDFFQPIDTGAKVLVEFTLHMDGKITEVKVLHSTASTIATTICENAIVKRSPFRPWTKEMVEVFGEKRTLRVMFNYL